MTTDGILTEQRASALALVDASFASMSSPDLVAAAAGVQEIRNLVGAFEARLVAELELRRTAGDYARQTTAELLIHAQQVSPAQARATVDRALTLAPRVALTGELLPPLLPEVAAACSEGWVSPEQAAVIIRCADELPSSVGPEALPVVEKVLLEAAAHEHPVALHRTANLLLARFDPDGDEPREDELERRRDVTLGRNRDGSGRLTGRLTAEATALLDTVLDTLSAPTPADDGRPDPRTAGQRRHDALIEMCQRLLRAANLPAAGGFPVTLLVRTTAADLTAATRAAGESGGAGAAGYCRSTGTDTGMTATAGVGLTPRNDVISLRSALACGEASIVPVVVDEDGAPLRVGRAQRLASAAQRLALAVRDGGCSFPGCDRPPGWTETHHVVPWKVGGRTDVDNLTLLCRFHHREFERRGWSVRMVDGLPEWIPPAWLDPARTPRRNTAHHPEIIFRVGPEAAARSRPHVA